jgi:hypothetical protein
MPKEVFARKYSWKKTTGYRRLLTCLKFRRKVLKALPGSYRLTDGSGLSKAGSGMWKVQDGSYYCRQMDGSHRHHRRHATSSAH